MEKKNLEKENKRLRRLVFGLAIYVVLTIIIQLYNMFF